MHSSRRHHRAARAVSVAFLALLGCAEQQESLIVLHVVAWEGGCSIDPGSDSVLPNGILDISFTTGYLAPVALLNQTASNSETGVETGEIQLQDVDVKLTLPQAPEIIDRLRERDAGLVEFTLPLSTNSIGPGETEGVFVEAVSPLATEALREEILAEFGGPVQVTLVATMSFHGTRTGNSVGGIGDVDAREFSFPIWLCFECLVNCSGCEEAMCPVDTADWLGGVCLNAQDLFLYPASCQAPP